RATCPPRRGAPRARLSRRCRPPVAAGTLALQPVAACRARVALRSSLARMPGAVVARDATTAPARLAAAGARFRRLVTSLAAGRRVEAAWVAFAVLNLAGMGALIVSDAPAGWETVPFHFVYVSFTILFGFRAWRARGT